MFTDAQLAQYDEQGAVTIDSPFTPEQLDRAEAAWDRLRADGAGPPYEDPDFVDLIQHPYFEKVAKKLLRADAVHLWWGPLAPHERSPDGKPHGDNADRWEQGCHVDVQATWEDFEATPRRMRAELWFWVNEVPANRGAMRILPGSHRPIMEHWSRVLSPEHKAMLPRVHGLRPPPAREKWSYMSYPEHIPDMDGLPWVQREPTPAVAHRGQILLVCTAGLHSAWRNEDTVSRKVMLAYWGAAGVCCGLPKNQLDDMKAFFGHLRPKLRPDRAHIVPDHFDWAFETNYEPLWRETCLPPHQR